MIDRKDDMNRIIVEQLNEEIQQKDAELQSGRSKME